MDISDCQMSGVGLGIIKWGQDYKALTVLYWSPPLSFVKRGISSAEALEVMSKSRTAVYPPFPPCLHLLHLVLFAPHISFFLFAKSFMLSLFISSVSLVSFTFHSSFLSLSFCLFSVTFFFVRPVSAYGHQEAILCLFCF